VLLVALLLLCACKDSPTETPAFEYEPFTRSYNYLKQVYNIPKNINCAGYLESYKLHYLSTEADSIVQYTTAIFFNKLALDFKPHNSDTITLNGITLQLDSSPVYQYLSNEVHPVSAEDNWQVIGHKDYPTFTTSIQRLQSIHFHVPAEYSLRDTVSKEGFDLSYDKIDGVDSLYLSIFYSARLSVEQDSTLNDSFYVRSRPLRVPNTGQLHVEKGSLYWLPKGVIEIGLFAIKENQEVIDNRTYVVRSGNGEIITLFMK